MFNPTYSITYKLLQNIKRISALIDQLNQKRFPEPVLIEFQKRAEAVSAYASTSIEGNPLPLTDVKQLLKNKPENIRNSEQEVLNYNEMLKEINTKLEMEPVPLTLDLILSVQKKIIYKLLSPDQSGILRGGPVFVNDPRLKKTIYWPPDHQDVRSLMTELIEFINTNKNKIDSLILSGIFHKQMVIIHPFMDGNGRTTRLVTKILLAGMGLNTFNLFSFENYYNTNVTKYFEMVGVAGNYYEIVKSIDFTSWLEYFTDGIIDELLRVEKELPPAAFTPEAVLQPHHHKILEHVKSKGYITDRDYRKLVERARATRHLDFQKLIDLKFIEKKGKSRATYYTLTPTA